MTRPVRFVAEHDDLIRKALRRLLEEAGIETDSFASPQEILTCDHHESCDCLLLNVWIPDPRCTTARNRSERHGLRRPDALHERGPRTRRTEARTERFQGGDRNPPTGFAPTDPPRWVH